MNFIFKLFGLAIKRNKSPEDYFNFQTCQAERVVSSINDVFVLDKSMSALDYGCGNGGYTFEFAKQFDSVHAIDFFVKPIKNRNSNNNNVKFYDADLLTYTGEPKDFVFCASIIEHIEKNMQYAFLENLKNNLKPGGYLYLSYPPFYSIIGGHKCAPFHYFPEKFAIYLSNKIKGAQVESYEKMWGTWGLHKTTIKEINEMLIKVGFTIIETRVRYMPYWYSKLFKNTEFFNWHVEFFCKRT